MPFSSTPTISFLFLQVRTQPTITIMVMTNAETATITVVIIPTRTPTSVSESEGDGEVGGTVISGVVMPGDGVKVVSISGEAVMASIMSVVGTVDRLGVVVWGDMEGVTEVAMASIVPVGMISVVAMAPVGKMSVVGIIDRPPGVVVSGDVAGVVVMSASDEVAILLVGTASVVGTLDRPSGDVMGVASDKVAILPVGMLLVGMMSVVETVDRPSGVVMSGDVALVGVIGAVELKGPGAGSGAKKKCTYKAGNEMQIKHICRPNLPPNVHVKMFRGNLHALITWLSDHYEDVNHVRSPQMTRKLAFFQNS